MTKAGYMLFMAYAMTPVIGYYSPLHCFFKRYIVINKLSICKENSDNESQR